MYENTASKGSKKLFFAAFPELQNLEVLSIFRKRVMEEVVGSHSYLHRKESSFKSIKDYTLEEMLLIEGQLVRRARKKLQGKLCHTLKK